MENVKVNEYDKRSSEGEGRTRVQVLLAAIAVACGLGAISVWGERAGVRVLTIVANLASPWGLAALVVGRLTSSMKRGAFAGGLTLLVGMAAFYVLIPALYIHSAREVVWTVAAMIVGPVMGSCGARLTLCQGGVRSAAVVAPSAMLLAEATWVGTDRRVWLWNFRLEPYRLIDLAILVALVALAFALPLIFVKERRRLPLIYFSCLVAGLIGATGFASLQWILLQV